MGVNTADREQMFVLALKELLPSLRSNSDKQIRDKIGKEKLNEAIESMTDYVEGACGELNRNETFAMYVQVLKQLSAYLTGTMSIPFTLNTATTHMSLLAYAVDQAFPGYAEVGLLKSIISPKALQPLVRKAG